VETVPVREDRLMVQVRTLAFHGGDHCGLQPSVVPSPRAGAL
jgi:hypothetical protein